MFLFDTDTISNVLKKRPSNYLLTKLKKIQKELQYTTAINISEIYYGAYRSEHRDKILSAFEIKVFPNINILPFDEESGKIYGEIKAKLEKKGLSRSEPNLRIASIAIQHGMILVTGNVNHFINIPRLRKVENWIV
ncbi:MAG: type II toxin-antitoxin system VapC family toxin [bacterium]